ncbi:3D domain-containing protein [Agathobaculum desmolans]|uniref:3D domain-containing protein n=1 Tax=Agathobaculum desmolans TaxID=39484 RepID=UPI00068C8E21|nr:3D domain-containing protein [Agathobaculum desmolans]
MSISLRKHASRLIAAALAVSAMASVSAAALEQPVAVLSSNLNASVGTVLTSDEINTAEQALSKAKAEAEAQKKAKAEAEAQKKAEAAAQAQAQAAATAKKDAYNKLLNDPVTAKTVSYSTSLLATEAIKSNAKSLGNYKLTFYCPCAVCNGAADAKTASGTTPTEGRTIAVDSSVIPLGSRVYIEGYGVFIAEDTGGAIKSNKIDVLVSSHSRAYDLGVKYANIYLLG